MKLYRTGAPPLMRESRINNINNARFVIALQALNGIKTGFSCLTNCDDVEIGKTYIFQVNSKRHQSMQIVTINEGKTDLDFSGQ